ncbi:hypothetical protein QOT17_014875 [Balamuthia mandrillaris]
MSKIQSLLMVRVLLSRKTVRGSSMATTMNGTSPFSESTKPPRTSHSKCQDKYTSYFSNSSDIFNLVHRESRPSLPHVSLCRASVQCCLCKDTAAAALVWLHQHVVQMWRNNQWLT